MADTHPVVPLLEARALHLWRGDKHLLRGVSFTLSSGQLLQVVGPNGVGKSSLLRAACGLLPIEAGDLFWCGQPMRDVAAEFNSQLAYLAHTNALKADLTARENLRLELAVRGAVDYSAIDDCFVMLGLAQCADLSARVLSAGQRRRLALARVVLCNTPLWILDEPTTNLDVAGTHIVEQLMLQHLQAGGAIFAAAHHGLLNGHAAVRNLELQA